MFLAKTSLSTTAQWNIFALSLSPEYVFLINLSAYPKITLLDKHYSHSCDLKSKGCQLGTFSFRTAMIHHSQVEGQEGVCEQHPAGGTHIQGYKRLSCRSAKSLFTKNQFISLSKQQTDAFLVEDQEFLSQCLLK